MSKKYRKGVFVVIYTKDKENVYYLLLKRKLHWTGWEFPKGGQEKGESKVDAVRREINEETGLEIISIDKMNSHGKYKYDRELPDRKGVIGQTYSLFAVRVPYKEPEIDIQEHSDYAWLEYEEARKKLTWPNQKKSLDKVHEWLNNKYNE